MITGSNKSIIKPNEVVSILSMNKAAFSIVKYGPPLTENAFCNPRTFNIFYKQYIYLQTFLKSLELSNNFQR